MDVAVTIEVLPIVEPFLLLEPTRPRLEERGSAPPRSAPVGRLLAARHQLDQRVLFLGRRPDVLESYRFLLQARAIVTGPTRSRRTLEDSPRLRRAARRGGDPQHLKSSCSACSTTGKEKLQHRSRVEIDLSTGAGTGSCAIIQAKVRRLPKRKTRELSHVLLLVELPPSATFSARPTSTAEQNSLLWRHAIWQCSHQSPPRSPAG